VINNMDNMTLFESYQYVNDCLDINEYIEFVNEQCDDGICEICESYNNGYITEEVADALLNVLYEATQEEIDKWLKSYDYDPKSKTININGSRRRITIGDTGNKDVDDLYNFSGPAVGMQPRSKEGQKALIKRQNNMTNAERAKAMNSGEDVLARSAKHGYKVSRDGIVIPKSVTKMDIQKFDNTVEHEAGHVKDLSNNRILTRLPSVFSKYNYNDIPKEYRSKFLAMKKDIKAGKIDPNSPEVKSFMTKVEDAVTDAKGDKDYKLKAAYDKINKDIDNLHTTSKKKNLLANAGAVIKKTTTMGHDRQPDEIRADLIAGESLKKRNGGNMTTVSKNAYSKGGVSDTMVEQLLRNHNVPEKKANVARALVRTLTIPTAINRDHNQKKLSGTKELKYITNYKKKDDKKK
jgi:hypothetical protein